MAVEQVHPVQERAEAHIVPAPVDLRDRYRETSGTVQMTGIQALARLAIDQHRRDRDRGWNIATFISGYEGSPLGGFDLELGRIRDILDANDVVFTPGLNEEAAVTAVQGTQLLGNHDDATRDGVVGLWYGKAPGLDRAGDAVRHGTLIGAHPKGGAVLFVGDDPAAKSSSVPCASEMALADLMVPTLYPADSQDILRLGQHAIELSRASGLWTALKIVTNVADGSSPVRLDVPFPEPVLPHGAGRHEPTAKLLQPTLGPLERDLVTTRVRLAREYARLNGLNQVLGAASGDRIGIIAAGRTALDVMVVLDRLGIDPASENSPIRLLRLGMIWPLEPTIVREFADGLDQVVVIEEKRSFIETALREVLYGLHVRPEVIGKTDAEGKELFPSYGELDVDAILPRLKRVLVAGGVIADSEPSPAVLPGAQAPVMPNGRTSLPLAARTPFFCSGCPHNTSTTHAGGAAGNDVLVGAGIGCHALVLLMDEKQVGKVTGLAQMGGEGLQWIGLSPFVQRKHYVQNLGDGTFDHSGSLAIRAAVAAGVNVTYKLLFNSAVAMTGGQRAVGALDVSKIVDILLAERVARVLVTTDDPRRYRRVRLPRGVEVWPRTKLDEAMQVLAVTPGVTVLIHDQECATERRRRRKRTPDAKPATRVFINERVCEGCGDCGRKSNCLSVFPVSTPLGRKTRIDQGTCNFDHSCVEGDCPAFMTVELPDARASRPIAGAAGHLEAEDLADPIAKPGTTHGATNVRITGIGGTGVVTISQIVALAGQLSGFHARSLDQTGLAQKGGAVVSDVVLARDGAITSNKISAGTCDLYLGCDILVAASERNLGVAASDRTRAVLSTSVVPTGAMVSDPSVEVPDPGAVIEAIEGSFTEKPTVLDARAASARLFGSDQYANMIVLGAGFQLGGLPLPATAIEEAIRLNGVAVERNIQAFRRGRQAVADSQGFAEAVRLLPAATETAIDSPQARYDDLVAYQSRAYAEKYQRVLDRVSVAEAAVPGADGRLTEAVSAYLYKLMAYKDEYEVARLATAPEVRNRISAEFGSDARASWRLHPPALRAVGLKRKLSVGPAFRPGLAVLAKGKRLRGTPLDPFALAKVRKVERSLVAEYLRVVDELCAGLTSARYDLAVEIARLPDMVRGYEEIKLANVEAYRSALAELMDEYTEG